MRSHCAGYGPQYDPTNPLIELAAMQTPLTAAEDALEDVSEKLAPWKGHNSTRSTA